MNFITPKKKKSKKNINQNFNFRVYKPLRLAMALIGSIVWIGLTLKKIKKVKKKYKPKF
jgi:hypothetical protein